MGSVITNNNIVFNNTSSNYTKDYCGGGTATWTTTNMNVVDPKLVNETTSPYDAHLQAGSPAIGAGVSLAGNPLVAIDFAGNPRPSPTGWDIGAYDAGASSTPPPPPPTNLLQNGGFENGLTGWGNYGNAFIVSGTGNVYDGTYALEAGTGAGGVYQDLTGVAPGSYTLSAAGKVGSSLDPGYIGVGFHDVNGKFIKVVGQPYSNTSWQTIDSGNSGAKQYPQCSRFRLEKFGKQLHLCRRCELFFHCGASRACPRQVKSC